MRKSLPYYHVDVFSLRPFTGNSLTVFPASDGLSTEQMQHITQEMRHFESIFLSPTEHSHRVTARVFALNEELDFAGHPILGAAAVLHTLQRSSSIEIWTFELKSRAVQVTTQEQAGNYRALLNQGKPEFLGLVDQTRVQEVASALNLTLDDLHPSLPLEVVSTGLRYLIVPIQQGLERAHIVHPSFETLLEQFDAQFAYVLDVNAVEGRHWNNDGLLEDVATGSAAGTVGAYLIKHAHIQPDQEFILKQGRFTGRPSQIHVQVQGQAHEIEAVLVGGDVSMVGHGTLDVLPD